MLLAASLVVSALTIAEPAAAAITGPDVSSWQHPNGSSINWNLVKAAGHSFAFVKATEATNYTNPYFAADWAAIATAGMDRGPYHFARPGSTASAASQAAYFASAIGNMGHPGDLPPVLDLEDTGGLSPDNLIAWTQSFLSTTQSLTNRIPMIYVSPNFWRTNMNNSTAFTAYPLWIAQWTSATSPSFPLPGGWTSWTFWQYTDSGSIPGIAAAVDVSRYCCSFGSLSALAFGSTTTQAPSPPAAGGTSLYAAMLNGTGTGQVEIHAMAQSSHYTQFSLHAATAFGPAAAADWQFFVASFQGDGQPDLFGVHTRNTGSGQVEVHVLSATSGYHNFILHSATPLHAVPPNHVEFSLGSLAGDHGSNLYAIALNATGSNTVEVHALSEANNYNSWALHSTTALSAIPNISDWQFRVGDRNGSGDLIGISHTSTGSGRTEVHALSRASGYQAFSIHTTTPLGYTSDAQFAYTLGDHDNDGIPDIYAVAMNGTGTGQTEIHVLSGASNYNSWIEHTPTGLAPTNPTSWEFSTY
jgi:lysozyme